MKQVDEFLTEFETKEVTPSAMSMVQKKPKFKLSFFVLPLIYLRSRFSKYNNDEMSYMYYKSYENVLNPLRFFLNYQKSKKYYKEPSLSKKYVYYPLHYQPEATTCVCAEKYEKQLFFIDSLAKSLPADTLLYVKEHYAVLGHRDPHFYVDMQKYPNVVIVSPWVSSRSLIDNSVAVATLTGTAGFEAMLLRKPVLLAGDMVFDNAPGIIKVNDIYDNYLKYLNDWKQPSREEVIKYLCASMRSYRKGNIYAQNRHWLLKDNIDDICNSLLIEMNNAS